MNRIRILFQAKIKSRYTRWVLATITAAICARNAQGIIGACLESIRRQTVAPDEVIVALDALSDSTGAVALQEC